MTKKEYYKLLLHPKWRAKRKQILEKKGNCCSICGKTSFLEIHHLYYIWGNKPWQYPLRAFKVLCRACHTILHKKTKVPWFKSHKEAKNALKL